MSSRIGDIPLPLDGETRDEYMARINFERDDQGRWWCLACGVQLRDESWRIRHYDSCHGFRGF